MQFVLSSTHHLGYAPSAERIGSTRVLENGSVTPSDTRRNGAQGIILILMAGLFLAANDGVAKWLVPYYPVGQLLFMHAVLVLVLLGGAACIRGRKSIRIKAWRAHLIRGLLFASASFAFVHALRYLPLAEVVAIAFAGPLITTALARMVLQEPVGWHRLGAVCVGFAGVLVMLSPGRPNLHWAVLLPLYVALSDACRDILTRQMTRDETTLSILVTTSAVIAGVSVCTVFSGWVAPRLGDIGWFSAAAVLFVTAHLLMIEAYRRSQASAIAPFRYVQLLWGIVIGYVIWQEMPDQWVTVGIVLIVASGVYIAIRETKLNAGR